MSTYFSNLNYTLGNEDTNLEYTLLPESTQHVFTAAGSGSRVTPLFAKKPRLVTCVDSSREQLSVAELRIASMRVLSQEDYKGFWGYPGAHMLPKERKKIFSNLQISDKARDILLPLFEEYDWAPILYVGRWERMLRKISFINRILVGKKGLGTFQCVSSEELDKYLQEQFPHYAWKLSVFLLGNTPTLNTLLYKGSLPRKNLSQSSYSFYRKAFNHLFRQGLARENFFLQLLFFGRLVFEEGLPLECDPRIYKDAQIGISEATINFVQGDFFDVVKYVPQKIDFVSCSDIPSYLQPPREQQHLQQLKKKLAQDALVVSRYYLRIPERLDTSGFQDLRDCFNEVIRCEKTQVYSFGIYKNTSI